jgi:hypothetical protein
MENVMREQERKTFPTMAFRIVWGKSWVVEGKKEMLGRNSNIKTGNQLDAGGSLL